MLMLVGAALCFYSNYLYMFENNLTNAVCHLRVWLLSIGEVLLFGFGLFPSFQSMALIYLLLPQSLVCQDIPYLENLQ